MCILHLEDPLDAVRDYKLDHDVLNCLATLKQHIANDPELGLVLCHIYALADYIEPLELFPFLSKAFRLFRLCLDVLELIVQQCSAGYMSIESVMVLERECYLHFILRTSYQGVFRVLNASTQEFN